MPKPDAQKKLVEKVFAEIQKQYAQEHQDEAAQLHNRFATAIDDIKPDAETLLLVFELLKQEVLGSLIDKMDGIKARSQEVKTEEESKPPPEPKKPLTPDVIQSEDPKPTESVS